MKNCCNTSSSCETKPGKTATGYEFMHFLKNWLTKHIMEEDMA